MGERLASRWVDRADAGDGDSTSEAWTMCRRPSRVNRLLRSHEHETRFLNAKPLWVRRTGEQGMRADLRRDAAVAAPTAHPTRACSSFGGRLTLELGDAWFRAKGQQRGGHHAECWVDLQVSLLREPLAAPPRAQRRTVLVKVSRGRSRDVCPNHARLSRKSPDANLLSGCNEALIATQSSAVAARGKFV